MKKLTLIVIVLIMALGMLVMPAAAQDDLTALARYFPGDAPLFAAFRTDDDLIETLDALAAKLGSVTPGGWTPGSLMEMLDTAATEVQPGGTFATVFRSWLGDSAAIGIYELRDQSSDQPVPPLTIAIRISDQDQAEALFDALPNADRYSLEEGDGYVLYSPDGNMSSDPYFLFRSDVLLITGDEALVEGGGELTDTLGDSADFTSAVGMLPADGYAAIAYADTPAIIDSTLQGASSYSDFTDAMGLLDSVMAAIQPQAFGITLLDDRSLVLDVASPLDAEAASAFNMMSDLTPVDLAFLQRIPASIPFVVMGTNLYGSLEGALENLRTLADMAPNSSDMNSQDVETALVGINFLVRGLTGMELEDAFGWMTGTYALAFGFSPSFSDIRDLTDAPSSNPFDLGFIVEATDAAQALFDGLANSLDNMATDEFTVSEVTLDDGTDALSLMFNSKDIGFPVELQIATGNGVFVVGTPRMVSVALNPPNVGLDASPDFSEANAYLLDAPYALLFLSSGNLEPLARAMTASGNPLSLRQSGKQVQLVLDLFNSISMSASALPDATGTLTRLVLTLSE